MVEKGPLTTMKLGSTGMSTSHWCAIVALWSAPGTREGHGTAQSARTYRTRFKVGFCPQVSSVPQVLYLHVVPWYDRLSP